MKQHRINIMKLGDRLLPISHNQHHITEARNTIPLHSPHQTHSLNEKGKHKKEVGAGCYQPRNVILTISKSN